MSISHAKSAACRERQEAILKLLAENGPMTSPELARGLRLLPRNIHNDITKMLAAHIIERKLLKWTPRYRRGIVLCWLPGTDLTAIKALEDRLATEKPSQASRFCLPRTG